MNIEELRGYKPQLCTLARSHHIDPDTIRVFGSVARNQAQPSSDVDLLVTLLPEADLFDLSGFNYEVNQLLGVHVDTAPDESLHPDVARTISDDVMYL